MNSELPIWFTIIRHEQLDHQLWGQRILMCIPCTPRDLINLYSEWSAFMLEHTHVQIALFTRDPEQTPISEHTNRALYSTLAPIPAPLAITENSKGGLEVVDDPPVYNDWNDINPG